MRAPHFARRLSRRDTEADADRFTVYVDPHHDHLSDAMFEVSAAGSLGDAIVYKRETGLASRMAHLAGVTGIRPPRRLELLPYSVARAEFVAPSGPGDPFNDGSQVFGATGLDPDFKPEIPAPESRLSSSWVFWPNAMVPSGSFNNRRHPARSWSATSAARSHLSSTSSRHPAECHQQTRNPFTTAFDTPVLLSLAMAGWPRCRGPLGAERR